MALPATHSLESTQELDRSTDLKLPSARLICVNPKVLGEASPLRVIDLDKPMFTLGRSATNDLVIEASGVSRSHARFRFDGEHWQVEDVGSSNGIMVNKSGLKQAVLKAGDIVSVGSVHFKLYVEPPAGKIVSDSEHQVSLFDTESTLVLNREKVDSAIEQHRAESFGLEPEKDNQGRNTVLVAVAAVFIGTLVITLFA